MLKNKTFLSFILLSFFVGFIFGEDTLGGGKSDYQYHEKYFFYFYLDFLDTLKNFPISNYTGNAEGMRNSPIFYMIFSLFLKMGFKISSLKFINLIIILPMGFFLYECINIKFKNISSTNKFYLLSIFLLSPTIRTLLAWPYPFLWALSFFIISLYFYLKFEHSPNNSKKIKLAYYNIISLALAAYFTPNFSVFSLYFFYKFYLHFRNSKETIKIIFLNIFLALPAIYFLITKDFYLLNAEVYDVDPFVKYNIINKIVIITTILFLFFLPLVPKIKDLKLSLLKANYLNLNFLILLLFIFVNIFFYNFLEGAGGGIFFHLSNILLNNSLIVYFIFTISILLFYLLNLYNFNNILIFSLLVLYNLQFTIYYKYFDPLIVILILFLFKFKDNNLIKSELIFKKYVIFYIFFLSLNFAKAYIDY
tara:strand:- start:124 stop:1386 length:1263 start_codon:yes stop_codon:yes gene_type:complete